MILIFIGKKNICGLLKLDYNNFEKLKILLVYFDLIFKGELFFIYVFKNK